MTSINFNYNINSGFNLPEQTSFKRNAGRYLQGAIGQTDKYIANPLRDKYGTKTEVEAAIKSNPRIQQILNEHHLHAFVNETELEKLRKGHLQNTRITAAKIYSNLPENLKKEINLQELQEAAMFHDYGKILIPDNILNKKGKLSKNEWAIMRRHSELGAELLKNKDLSPRTIELVKFHHLNGMGSGYPSPDKTYRHGLDTEVLTLADKFEALMEERSYKSAMSRNEALGILENDVKSGLISPEVFDALKKSV